MPPTINSLLLSPTPYQQVRTVATDPTPSRSSDANAEKSRTEWQKVIDYKLIEWGSHPEQLEDEGIDPPSRDIVQLAVQLAERFAEDGSPPPDSVVPDPNGGIVFELRHGNTTEVIHIWDDGQTEYQRFEGTSLVERRT